MDDGREVWDHSSMKRRDDLHAVHQAGLEAQARTRGFPTVDAMVKAQVQAVQRIAERLHSGPPEVSLDDCYLVAVTAMSLASTPRARSLAASLHVTLEPHLKIGATPPTQARARPLLRALRSFLEALEIRGAVSLAGVGELVLTEEPLVGDLSADVLAPEMAVEPSPQVCGYCGAAFMEGDAVAVVPGLSAGPWSSIEVHRACHEQQRRTGQQ